MVLISSVNNQKIKNLKKKSIDSFISFDIDVIKKADKLGLLKEVYSDIDLNLSIATTLVSDDVLKVITPTNLIGKIVKLESKAIKENKIIYLDEINDPYNLGKIILLMDKYHYKELILSKNSVSPYNKKCLETVKEKIFNVNINYGDINALIKLKNDGYQLLATGLKSSVLLNEVNHQNKYVLIMGNESRGVNKNILEISNIVIKIPIKNIDSLNVSVATSIMLDNL